MTVANYRYIVWTVYISSTKGNTKGRTNIFELFIHAGKACVLWFEKKKSMKQYTLISYMEYTSNIVVNYPTRVNRKNKAIIWRVKKPTMITAIYSIYWSHVIIGRLLKYQTVRNIRKVRQILPVYISVYF